MYKQGEQLDLSKAQSGPSRTNQRPEPPLKKVQLSVLYSFPPGGPVGVGGWGLGGGFPLPDTTLEEKIPSCRNRIPSSGGKGWDWNSDLEV